MPLEREPITGPLGVLLCGGAGGVVPVGFGAELVGCGWLGTGLFDVEDDAWDEPVETCPSLMAPSLGRSADEVPPCAIGAPLGRSVPPAALLAPDGAEALFVSWAGGWLAPPPQATQTVHTAQTRAATTAVAAALAGATVPRIGMVATVAK